MTNLEWLALMKKTDDASGEEGVRENLFIYKNEFRQTKALEIIAEELIDVGNCLMTLNVNGIKISTNIK